MNLLDFGLLILSILGSVIGQFFLKAGALRLGKAGARSFKEYVLHMLTNPELLFGLTCYSLRVVPFILLLTRVSISVAGPAIALVYVFTVLIGYFLFHEPVSLTRLFGLGLIVCGVLLVIWKN